jgi:hypothetical protein
MYERMYVGGAERKAGLLARFLLAFLIGLASLWLWMKSAADLVGTQG